MFYKEWEYSRRTAVPVPWGGLKTRLEQGVRIFNVLALEQFLKCKHEERFHCTCEYCISLGKSMTIHFANTCPHTCSNSARICAFSTCRPSTRFLCSSFELRACNFSCSSCRLVLFNCCSSSDMCISAVSLMTLRLRWYSCLWDSSDCIEWQWKGE